MEVNDASGNPTRQLTQDQYREWVRQSVSGEIWRKFAAALSIFGITTIFGVWTFTNSVIEDRIKSQTNKLPEEVKGWIGNEITYQVKHNKLVDTAAKQTVTQLTEQRLIDTELRRLIVTQSQNILRGEDPSLRELALQQVLLFGEPQQKSDAISWVLQNPTHAGSVFQLALRQYQPPTNTRGQIRDQNEVLRNVLERALNFRGEFNGESWKVLRTILAQQGGIRLATEWVRTSENLSDSPPLRDIIQAIAEVGGLGAGEQFVNWISSDRPELIVLGLHGLKELNFGDSGSAEQTKQRHGLARKAITAKALVDREPEGLSDFLGRSFDAIQGRDHGALRRYASSDLASQPIKSLLAALARDNRAAWARVRQFTSPDSLREYGKYENDGLGAAVREGLASLLDVGPTSADWKSLILPIIEESKGLWTESGPARLLVNAWVQKLQRGGAPEASIDVVARLFIESHPKHQPLLSASANFASYRFLLGSASRDVINSFLDGAPAFIGTANRDRETQDIYDNNEATILSDVLTRALRDQFMTEDRLSKLRSGLQAKGPYQTRPMIWFTAVAQAAGKQDILVRMRDASIRESNYRRVLAALAEAINSTGPPKPGGVSRHDAAALLFLLANQSFLRAPGIQSAAEAANLHLLARDPDRFNDDPQILARATAIASEARAMSPWVGRLNDLPMQRIDGDPVQLTQDVMWLSFEPQANRLPQVSIDPAGEMSAIVVSGDERVLEPEIQNSSDTSPAIIRIPDVMPGTMYLRLNLQALRQSTFAALRHEDLYRAANIEAPKPGSDLPEVRLGSTVTIQTSGNDDVWFRLNAKSGTTYVLRTLRLRATKADDSIDTEIEVRNPSDNQRLYSDDDGGGDLASMISFRSDRDGPYHIRVRNSQTAAGSFAFEAIER